MPPRNTRRRPGAAFDVLAALIWTLIVAALLLIPGDRVPDSGGWNWLDKPAHAILFAVHSLLLAGALEVVGRPRRSLKAAALLSGLYASVLEVAQIFVEGRFWSWWDLVAGWLGIALAAGFLGRQRARLRPSP